MLGALILAALLQTGTAPADWQAEGLKALDEKRYDAAVAAFRKGIAADPKDYAAHFHLALSYSLLDRDAEAIDEYRETLRLKPGLYEALLNSGILLLRQKRAAEAVAPLRDAAEQKPAEFRPRFYEAEALLASGRAGEAAEWYRRALAIDGKSAAAEAGLGRALAMEKKVDEAAAHLRKAAELDTAYKDVLLELASLYEREKRTAEAAQIYAQFPENPAAQERAGELMLESGKASEAIPALEAAVKASPTAANRMTLVKAYLREKQTDKAFALLVTAVQAEPKNFDLRMLAGRMLRDMRKFPEAANQLMGAAQLKADSVEAWNELSGVLIMAEKYPEALGALDRVKALGAETAAHHYFRAIVLDKLHLMEPAIESYEKFLAMSRDQRPDEEFKARQRVRILKKELSKR
jgi:tetratricopeptide (TPR) repeat protein